MVLCFGDGGGLTRRQWFTLCAIGSVHFASAICISLQAPFYPQEAESKNATATEYGLVFGVFELVSFFSSPILGSCIDVIGAKILLNTGILVAATCSILFGLLDLLSTHSSFITLSFIVRMVEALGSSAAVTSAFAITAAVFPNSVGTTFAALEIFYGLGYIAGPTIGGFLFTFGGYMLPFLVMGTVLLLDGAFIYFALPSVRGTPKPKASIFKIFKVPAVVLDSLAIATTSMCMGFYSATLEPHIREFELTPVELGLVFIISGATYASTAPLVGRLCDVRVNPKHMILLGNVCTICSVLAIGPAPFLPLQTTLWLVIVGLIFQGLGMACILVSGFIDAIRSAVAAGFPDEITTYGLISGLWASSFSLGDFIGPSVAGALVDSVGFRWATLFIVVVHIIMFTCMSVFLCGSDGRKKYKKMSSLAPSSSRKEEKDPCVNRIACWDSDSDYKSANGYGSIANGSSLSMVKVTA